MPKPKNILSLISVFVIFCLLFLFAAFTEYVVDSFYPENCSYVDYINNYEPAADNNDFVLPRDMIEYEKIDQRVEGLEMEGRIPYLNNNVGNIYGHINNEINRIRSQIILNARESRARSVYFNFDTFFSEPYMSIIIKSTATSASSKTEVASVNFNIITGDLIYASDIVGTHVVQLADRLLDEMIRRNPGRYNPSFAGIRNNQAFSITDEKITFWFNEFQLAPGFDGIVPLSLRLNDILEVTLTRDLYHIREGFNLKMVPLRIVRQLGYAFIWDPETGGTSIFHDGELVIKVFPGINDYIRESRFTRSLESAPEIIGITTYVPISFFDQILNMVAFNIDDNNTIVFASYLVSDDWFER